MSSERDGEPGEAPWPGPWLRGMLGLAIMAVLAHQDTHGYAIAQALQERGFGRVTGGSLYPVLGRLEESGQVVARWAEGDGGPGRKVYALTEAGRLALAQQELAWTGFRGAFDALLGPTPDAPERR